MRRGTRHQPGLDGLRGVSALVVAVYHAWVLGGYALLDNGPLRAVVVFQGSCRFNAVPVPTTATAAAR